MRKGDMYTNGKRVVVLVISVHRDNYNGYGKQPDTVAFAKVNPVERDTDIEYCRMTGWHARIPARINVEVTEFHKRYPYKITGVAVDEYEYE
jgi:hypothetical protein